MNAARLQPFLVLVVVVALAPFVAHYPVLLTQALIFGLFAAAFNLLLGQLGFLSFGQAIFSGLGAYTTGLILVHNAHVPLLAALLASIAAGALGALVVGFLSIQGAGVYAVMLTFAFNELAFYIAFQWREVTGGDNGLRGVTRVPFFGVHLESDLAYYAFVAAIFVLVFYALLRVIDSPLGHVLRAIRENERRARAVGYNVRGFKVVAFVISGAVTGLAGALYALLYGFVPLEIVGFGTTTDIVIMGILGGIGSPYGAIFGAAIYTILSDQLSHVWSHWPLALGVIFCAVVLVLRGGLVELLTLIGARRSLAQRA